MDQMGFRYFEDFTQGEVIELGSRTVSGEEMLEFARQFDPQPFHLDAEAAKKSLLGGLCASGWHTGSIFMRFFAEGLLNHCSSQGSPGMDKLNWPTPLWPGDTVSARTTIVATRLSKSRPTMGIVSFLHEMTRQNGDLVLRIENSAFMGRRPA